MVTRSNAVPDAPPVLGAVAVVPLVPPSAELVIVVTGPPPGSAGERLGHRARSERQGVAGVRREAGGQRPPPPPFRRAARVPVLGPDLRRCRHVGRSEEHTSEL